MSDEKEKLLFTATNPFGYKVVLTTERYHNHIISSDNNHQAHPEFTPEEVKEAIEDPWFINESNLPDKDVYFGKSSQYSELYLKVVVENYPDYGNVSTAHLTKNLTSGVKKEGGLKYANYKSVL